MLFLKEEELRRFDDSIAFRELKGELSSVSIRAKTLLEKGSTHF